MAVSKNARDPKQVKSVMMRMGQDYIDQLDELCEANSRSRREIVEILVNEAWSELQIDSEAKLNPV